jgi:hypothetical protein
MRSSVLLLFFLAVACSRNPAPAASVPVPAPAPAEPPPASAPPPVSTHVYPATFCVIRGGRIEAVEIDPRDSTYQGQPIARVFPVDSTYAANASWYRSSKPIGVSGSFYVKYSIPRILGATDVVPVATFHGVTVFAEPTANLRRPDVIYLPTRPGCVFQPYTHGELP